MKNVKFIMVAIFLQLSLSASAYDFTVDGMYYNIVSLQDLTCAVTNDDVNDTKYSGDIVIPEQVTYNGRTLTVVEIGSSAFSNSTSLTSVSIGKSVNSIGESAFSGCTALMGINIPNSVSVVCDYAFNGCNNLRNLMIEDGNSTLTVGYSKYTFRIGGEGSSNYYLVENIFSGCPLETVYLGRNIVGYEKHEGLNVYTNTGFFEGKKSLVDVKIGGFVTVIDEDEFYGCIGLTDISIPNSVISIGNSAFSHCSNLNSVSIQNSVTKIGDYAFDSCSKLTSIVIPNSVISIGDHAFYGCSSLTSVSIPNSVTSIGNMVFRKCSSLTSVSIPNSITQLSNWTFEGCSSLTTVRIEDGAEALNIYKSGTVIQSLFEYSPLQSLYLGRDLIVSDDYHLSPFYNQKELSEIIIGPSVTLIPSNAFYGCDALENVKIPNSVTTIGGSAFYGCSSLASINLGASVADIGASAFANCEDLKTIYIQNSIPPKASDDTFTMQQYLDATVYVPQGSLAAYQAADVWMNFWGLQEGTFTGISGVEAATGLDVSVSDGCIVVDNATGRVTVYDISGVAVASGNADGGSVSIAVPGHGVYIVRVGSKTVKVCL